MQAAQGLQPLGLDGMQPAEVSCQGGGHESNSGSIYGEPNKTRESQMEVKNGGDDVKSSNSSSYSIVDYESDQTSSSDHAQAEIFPGDTINQTNVVITFLMFVEYFFYNYLIIDP